MWGLIFLNNCLWVCRCDPCLQNWIFSSQKNAFIFKMEVLDLEDQCVFIFKFFFPGLESILHLSDCQHYPVAFWWVLLLCLLHFCCILYLDWNLSLWDQKGEIILHIKHTCVRKKSFRKYRSAFCTIIVWNKAGSSLCKKILLECMEMHLVPYMWDQNKKWCILWKQNPFRIYRNAFTTLIFVRQK